MCHNKTVSQEHKQKYYLKIHMEKNNKNSRVFFFKKMNTFIQERNI